MRYNIKIQVFFVFFFASACAIFAQQTSFEKVDFSIPKTIYFTGERVWIASSASKEELPASSQIIYAELVNRFNESVAISKMPLVEGSSFNFLQIPTNIPSDHYLLRVFTRVSPHQNLEQGLVQRFITVFNSNVPPAVVAQRKNLAQTQNSSEITLSQEDGKAGSTLTIQLPKGTEINEVSIAAVNPFLSDAGKISSRTAYSSIQEHSLIPELFGHVIEAKIDEVEVDTTQLYYVSVHGEKSALFTDRPNAAGSLYFDAGGMKHWNYLVAQADGNKSLLDFGIVSPAPVTQFQENFTFPELEISPADQAYLEELLKGGQVEGYFVNEYDESSFPVVTGFVEDRTYLLDDYTRFETVETVVKEYIQEISVKNIKKKKEFRSIDEALDGNFDSNPLMLIDALPVFDSDKLAAFDPKEFKSLDVLSRSFYLNEEKFPGVMSFSSYKNDFGGFPIPSNGIYLDYAGIQPRVVSFQSLFDAPSQDENIMDWRTVLFWSATSGTDELSDTIQITVPQLKGTFLISVKASSEQGMAKEYLRTFEVK